MNNYEKCYVLLMREAAKVLADVLAEFDEDGLPESFRHFLIDELEGAAYEIEDGVHKR